MWLISFTKIRFRNNGRYESFYVISSALKVLHLYLSQPQQNRLSIWTVHCLSSCSKSPCCLADPMCHNPIHSCITELIFYQSECTLSIKETSQENRFTKLCLPAIREKSCSSLLCVIKQRLWHLNLIWLPTKSQFPPSLNDLSSSKIECKRFLQ